MQTENPKVAAIWAAWLMTEKSIGQIVGDANSPVSKAERIREIFVANYQAVAQTTGITEQEKPATVS